MHELTPVQVNFEYGVWLYVFTSHQRVEVHTIMQMRRQTREP